MRNIFEIGSVQVFLHTVESDDTATFDSGEVHPVYATFALARDAEWAGRLFVLEMKEGHEEGIGTYVHIDHKAPAFVGEEVSIKATLKVIEGNSIVCDFIAKVGERIIATGSTGQKILTKEKLTIYFETLRSGK